MRKVSGKSCSIEKIKAHILCPVTFFFENGAIYEIIRKNVVEPDMPLMKL